MEGKKSFLLYADLITLVEKLPNDKAGELFKIIFDYVNDKNPTISDLILQIAFEPIKLQLKRDLEVWKSTKQIRSEIGKLGGIKSGESRRKKQMKQKLKIPKQNEANEADNVTVTVTDTVNDNNIPPTPYEGASVLPELSAQIAEFQKSNPTKYPKELYERFREYWGAPVISGRGLGKPLWRTQKTWVLSGRLATWNSRNKPQTTTSSERKFDRV